MKNALKFLLTLVVALLLLMVVRTYVCTIVTITDKSMAPRLMPGDRILVDKISSAHYGKGQLVLYADSLPHLAEIVATAGDTVQVDTLSYLIPDTCCSRCDCPECRLLMVRTGQSQSLIKQRQILGKGHRLFNLKIWW